MPHINRIRVNNVKYNFGTQYYDDFVLRFSGKNTIYDLANGGGKSVLMLLLLQNLLPNCTLDEKQPIEKLFRSGNGNTTIHSLIEWKLNPCHVKNGFQYMTTGFCARKAKNSSGEEGENAADRAAIDYFNYCIFYRQFNDNDLKNLPLSNGKERITYLGLRSYLQELEKKNFYVEVKIFDRKGDYQRFISQYGLFESEWEIIRGINKTEGHVRTYFETNYRTTRKVVEDLLIEEIIEKSFYHKAGTDRESGEMAHTLLDLKDQLVLLSKKKNEIHYYDKQIELLTEFAERIGSLQGMYLKKQGLEEQLVKTYHTTLQRHEQKKYSHQQLIEKDERLNQQRTETACRIDTAEIEKKEQQLKKLEIVLKEKEKEISKILAVSMKKHAELEERECDNHYLNYLEYEKEYLTAKKAVEAILDGSGTLEEDLFALANELKALTELRQQELAEKITKLQEELSQMEAGQAELLKKEKELEIRKQVLKGNIERSEAETLELTAQRTMLAQEENSLLLFDLAEEYRLAKNRTAELEKRHAQTTERLEECKKELYGTQITDRAALSEEKNLMNRLEALGSELGKYSDLKERMNRLLQIYGGTGESVENILFQRQKELTGQQQKHMEEKRVLQECLTAAMEGIPVPQPQDVSVFLEEILRYYDEKAVSGYEYLKNMEPEERERFLEHYPMLPYGIVTAADLEELCHDRKFKEKEFGKELIPIISKNALEREKDLTEESMMIFAGKTADVQKIREALEKLETLLGREYEQERILKQDYDFVQKYLQQCLEQEEKERSYEELKHRWKELQQEREERTEKIHRMTEQEELLKKELTELAQSLKEAAVHQENMQKLSDLEEASAKAQENSRLAREGYLEAENLCEETKEESQALAEEIRTRCQLLETRREELKRVLSGRELFQGYVSEKEYPVSGMEFKELEAVFAGKKAAYEQKNTDIADKQKLAVSYERSMEQQKEQLQLRGCSLEDMQKKEQEKGCIRTDMEQLLVLKKEVFEVETHQKLLESEKRELEAEVHKNLGSIQHARQAAEEKYGELQSLEISEEQLELFVKAQKEQLKTVEAELAAGQKQMRDLEEQCYALKAMAQDMERMMNSAGIVLKDAGEYLEAGISLKEQYEQLRRSYEKIVSEESKRLETAAQEKQMLTEALEKMGAYELAEEIRKNLPSPQNEQQIKEQMEALKNVTDCLELEKNRIGKDMDSLQELKDQFEAQCLQNCLNMKEELDRLQKLSRISMDQQMISMITLQIPYLKEELYESAMSEYIDEIIEQVEMYDTQAQRLEFIRSRLAFKRLFSVIVTNMDAIRLTLYKRERMKEQSRYLKYEEAVGSTGQSQGIYIQFLVAIINYISSINSGNADPLELKKVIFIDNPFGAAKDIYIWEPIFKLLKANNVQLIVPARGATPAITGHFEVNYILGQKLIDGRQQTVVVDYRSQTEEQELEYSALTYEQGTLELLLKQ